MSGHDKRLLVLGTGFAALGVLRGLTRRDLLDRLEVLFVSSSGSFEYLPSAPELVSDKVTREEIRRDLSHALKMLGAELVRARATELQLEDRRVSLETGEVLDYDYLAVGIGARPWMPPGGLPSSATTTYRVDDTLRFRQLLSEASGGTVLIVGAGLTGVEVAGEVVDLGERLGVDYRVTIVEKLERAAPCMGNARAGELAKSFLESRGVRFILGRGVERMEEGRAILEDGEELEFEAAAWTAGVVPPEPVERLPRKYKRGRFMAVDEYMRVIGAQGAYAAGDCVHLEVGGRWAAKMAEEAMFQGETIAENIWRELKGLPPRGHKIRFSVQSPRCLVSLGAGRAVLAYGKRIALLGRFPYMLKKRIERRFMAELDELLGRLPEPSARERQG